MTAACSNALGELFLAIFIGTIQGGPHQRRSSAESASSPKPPIMPYRRRHRRPTAQGKRPAGRDQPAPTEPRPI
jgi:hypothetical protein